LDLVAYYTLIVCYVSVADFLKITDPMILIKLPPMAGSRPWHR
jgi:hypothetical protein